MVTYDAIIPAGGNLDPDFARRVGTDSKALIDFNGLTLLTRTINNLRESAVVQRIVVVGCDAVQAEAHYAGADIAIADVGSGPDNILAGLNALGATTSRVVVITCDMPFVDAHGIHRFIHACPDDIDFCVPIVRRRDFDARFPGTSSMFVPLKDDQWTLGGAYLISVDALRKSQVHIERVFQNRKSMMGMAKLLGPVFLLKFVTKTLSMPDIKQKCEQILHASGYPVTDGPPELAFDIDDLEDYEYALSRLAANSS